MLNITLVFFLRLQPGLPLTLLCLQDSWIRAKTDSALLDGVDPAHIAACQKLAREGKLSFLTWHSLTVVRPERRTPPFGTC